VELTNAYKIFNVSENRGGSSGSHRHRFGAQVRILAATETKFGLLPSTLSTELAGATETRSSDTLSKLPFRRAGLSSPDFLPFSSVDPCRSDA
jgi:hypothetical protein